MDVKSIASELLSEAKKCNQRRMIVLFGKRMDSHRLLREIVSVARGKKLIMMHKKDVEYENAETAELRDIDDYLGTTYDFVAVDFHHSLVPNDLGKIINVCRGGGLICLLFPKPEEWHKSTNFFHEVILTPPYSLNDIKHNFSRFLEKKIWEGRGITIIDSSAKMVLKDGKMKCSRRKSKKLKIPEKTIFPKHIYDMCLTQDQINALYELEKIWEGGTAVIVADRGRGKSSILGIFLGALARSRGKLNAVITSPSPKNVREIFRFARKILEMDSMIRDVVEKDGEIVEIRGRGIKIRYFEPTKAAKYHADVHIVDEAAGIPVPLLFKYLSRSDIVVYSSTVHGYEGTGRTFSIRFLGGLRKRVKDFRMIEMLTPIRYSEDDPIEEWSFSSLLLDAEPPEIKEVDLNKLKYIKGGIEDLLRDERKLREYYGIFVLAHYRNSPNDFGILCDAPNHEVRYLETKDGRVVCSVQLAREGGLPDDILFEMYYGHFPAGNLIPDTVIKHYRNIDFGRLKGYRIVRIATHPDLMDRGIGSKMLQKIFKEDADWIGASFGATRQLLNFWLKNGFHVIHISPKESEVTGEYSVIVIRPKSKRAKKIVKEIRKHFAERFIISLAEIHRNMDVGVAHLILKDLPKKQGEISLSPMDWKRIIMYAYGPAMYEVVRDAIYKLAVQYFTVENDIALNEEQEMILTAKVLQGKHWDIVAREIDRGPTYVVIELREIIRKFVDKIREDYSREIEEFWVRFHGEKES